MYDPAIVKVEAATLTIDTVAQFQLPVEARDKSEQLAEVLRAEKPDQAIVFVRTKIRCDQLYRTLRDRGMNVRALHGDMSQGSRDGVMLAFKGGRVPILVATDVAARGLDISTVTHVINYDVPTSPDTYVHRIGRTGRVGRSGRAITFVEPRQKRELEAIEKHIGTSIERWQAGASAKPTPVQERPRRHEKPHVADRHEGEEFVTLALAGGRAAGIRVRDVVAAVTAAAGIEGEAVREVRVLERYSLLSVPASEVDGLIARQRAHDRGPPAEARAGRLGRMSKATMNVSRGGEPLGAIEIEFFDEDAPVTVENFRDLAAAGLLRRPDLPPRDPGLHDPGRLSGRASAPAARAISSRTRSTTTRSCAARWRWPTPGRTPTVPSSSS